MRITVIVDNHASGDLLAEHGLALWIEARGRRVLFDTGAGRALAPNARALKIDLRAAASVVLSHGHYDHGGGLPAVLRSRPGPEVYAHPAAAQPRYAVEGGRARFIGLPTESAAAQARVPEEKLHWVAQPVGLGPGIGLTGCVPRETGYEDTGGPFFLDRGGQRPDPLEDDMAMWVATARGLVVCVGCSHAGIVNTLRHALKLSGADRLRAVLGGFHLMGAGEERLERTLRDLKALKPGRVAPCHCTGDEAARRLKDTFGKRYIAAAAGTRLAF
jgi:7,8-dihydropterin-6-yl-methyl-4-(beta-D-ribofuranosyl)aminobenzene 5'-phosphate synthase